MNLPTIASGRNRKSDSTFSDLFPYTWKRTLTNLQPTFIMEDKSLTLELEAQIKETAGKLKAEKKLRKIYPLVVFGDTSCGEKEVYVAYMSEPTFPQFSKFMVASRKDEVMAMKTLAKDCFVDGDKELVDNESLFLFGLMGQLTEIISTRQSMLVNL